MFELSKLKIPDLYGNADKRLWQAVLDVATPDEPLDIENAAILIKAGSEIPEAHQKIIEKADSVKRQIFSSAVKLFVPVYISNSCVNDCAYCAYGVGNDRMPRRTLTLDELRREVEIVAGMGYRVIELVTGESPDLKIKGSLVEYVRVVKDVLNSLSKTSGEGETILMSWALSDEEFMALSDSPPDCFYIWQETYDEELFGKYHPAGYPKADFSGRIGVFDRAIKAGIKRVGLGVLFGLAPWEFDVLSLIAHGKYLRREYGITIDAVGIPRFKPAEGARITEAPYPVSDNEIKLAAAIYRLAFPNSHVFLNTREKLNLIFELLNSGGSEMNIACAIYPGGYGSPRRERQFSYYSYPTEKTVDELKDRGYIVTHYSGKPEVNSLTD
ncbi:MAG: radical SAM protein [bacterium]